MVPPNNCGMFKSDHIKHITPYSLAQSEISITKTLVHMSFIFGQQYIQQRLTTRNRSINFSILLLMFLSQLKNTVAQSPVFLFYFLLLHLLLPFPVKTRLSICIQRAFPFKVPTANESTFCSSILHHPALRATQWPINCHENSHHCLCATRHFPRV